MWQLSEASSIESVPFKASMIDILLGYNSFKYWRWNCFCLACCLLWLTLSPSQTLLVLLAVITAVSLALMLSPHLVLHATLTMSSLIIAACLVQITVSLVLKPLVFAKVAPANFTFLNPPGLAIHARLVHKFVHFQQSSNAFQDITWSTQSVSSALLTAKHVLMPTLVLSAMLAIILPVNRHALHVLFHTVQAAIKVDNVSSARIIAMELLVINFAHLFAKYVIVKFAINAHLDTISAQQDLVRH